MPESPSPPPLVVVIDDRRASLIAMQALLQPLGYRVLVAENAAGGLTQTLAEDVARVITDVREKDRRIGVLAHELRDPMSAIVVGLNVLTQSPNLSDSDRSMVDLVLRSSARMTTMIHDLLDYTRTSLGDFPHNPVATSLKNVCDIAVEEMRSGHPDRTITCQIAGDVNGIWDPVRLQQVVSNLVGNALEHSKGPVSVDVEGAEHEVVLSVHNDGEPIPTHLLPVLFEPFRRGDRSPHGLGLGLYIVREIIRRHGGTIDVRSSPDAGTTFISRWPRHPGRNVMASATA